MWIVGDSHVFWLERFVASTEVRFSGSLLECQDCQIAFHGYRGGTVPSLAASPDLTRTLAGGVPSVCIISVGGNNFETCFIAILEPSTDFYDYCQCLCYPTCVYLACVLVLIWKCHAHDYC